MGGCVEDRQPKPAQFRPVRSRGIVMSPKTTLSSLKIVTFRIMISIVLDTAPIPQGKKEAQISMSCSFIYFVNSCASCWYIISYIHIVKTIFLTFVMIKYCTG